MARRSSARVLSGARTGVIGLALARPPDLLTVETFFMHFLAGVEKVLTEGTRACCCGSSGDHPDEEIQQASRWWGNGASTASSCSTSGSATLGSPQCETSTVPAVLCGGP